MEKTTRIKRISRNKTEEEIIAILADKIKEAFLLAMERRYLNQIEELRKEWLEEMERKMNPTGGTQAELRLKHKLDMIRRGLVREDAAYAYIQKDAYREAMR